MPEPNGYNELEPVAGTKDTAVQVLSTQMRIRHVNIDRPSIIAYFKNIPADKQEIALVHALEIGVAELTARRERFQK
jgi:hypothetical protein